MELPLWRKKREGGRERGMEKGTTGGGEERRKPIFEWTRRAAVSRLSPCLINIFFFLQTFSFYPSNTFLMVVGFVFFFFFSRQLLLPSFLFNFAQARRQVELDANKKEILGR